MSDQPEQELVRARATIHLPGLPFGRTVTVDRTDPYVAEAISHGYLVPIEAPPASET